MKKQLLKSALIAMAGIGLLAGSALATPLQDTLDSITVGGKSSINAETGRMSDGSDSYWNITASGGSFATMVLNITGLSAGTTFGIFDSANASNVVQLFGTGTATGAQQTITFHTNGDVYTNGGSVYAGNFNSTTFGYYVSTGSATYYSDSALNGGVDHMAAFRGNNKDMVQIGTFPAGLWTDSEYLLAFESGNDFDFNDMVVMVESVDPVPEPTTMLLFGTGLLGLAGVARRKRAN